MIFTAIKFFHLLALLSLFSASVIKNLLLGQVPILSKTIQRCRTADQVSGAAAGAVVLTGIGLLYLSPKGSAFYTANSVFWLKIAVLVVASALIVRTKVFFREHARRVESGAIEVPRSIVSILKFDLASLVLLTYLGVLIVNGIGLNR
jgi:putative membrane protein